MLVLSRQLLVAACAALVGTAGWWAGARSAGPRVVDAGLWFEDVAYESARLSAPIADSDLTHIEEIARSELVNAFVGLPITFSDRRDATYRIAVVQKLRDPRFRRDIEIAGESRAVSGLGGQGWVSFSFLASGATACASENANRASIIEAIGRGIGRSAVHEFAHQLLPTSQIHNRADIESYEYESASRCEQYSGPMHWNVALPLLQRRLGDPPDDSRNER